MMERKNAGYVSIPKEWKFEKIDDTQITINPENISDNFKGNYFYYSISNVGNNHIIEDPEVISQENAPSRAKRLVKIGDIAYSTVRPYLKSKIIIDKNIKFPAIFSTGFAILRFNNTLDNKFVFHQLDFRNFINQVSSRMVGSNYPAINLVDLKSCKVILPPLPEQRKIAAILSSVDQAIQRTEEVIDKTERLKKGMMQKLFTEGIGKGKETNEYDFGARIISYPTNFELTNISDIFKIERGKSYPRRYESEEGIPYVHYGDIHANNFKELNLNVDYDSIPKIDVPLVDINEKYLLTNNSIVLADASEDYKDLCKNILIKNPNNKPIIAGLHTLIAKPNQSIELHSEFSKYLFDSNFVKFQIMQLGTGSTVIGMTKSNFKDLIIPIPNFEIQETIGNILYQFDLTIKEHKIETITLQKLKKSLMQKLLTGKIRVKT